MKKFSLIIFIAAGLFLSACNSSPKTGGATSDSGSVGNSGASDTTQATQGTTTGAAAASGTPSSGSDTSTTGH
jgi:hypothetical protein